MLNGVAWKLLMIFNCTSSLSGGGIIRDGEGYFGLPIQYFKGTSKDKELKTNDDVTKL